MSREIRTASGRIARLHDDGDGISDEAMAQLAAALTPPPPEPEVTPYDEMFEHIERHTASGSAVSAAKLILSLYNDDFCFSYRECIGNLDNRLSAIAVRMAEHFAVYGETPKLRAIGSQVHKLFPDLWEVAYHGTEAKRQTARAIQEERHTFVTGTGDGD